MSHVETVRGPIHPDEMGLTFPHEHIVWGPPGWEYDPEWWFHNPRVYAKCLADLVDYCGLGGKTIVDCSGIGMGRDIELYRMLSRYSGVHVVASTGFWAGPGLYNHFRDRENVEYMEELFVHELTQGIGNTGVKAGVIKVGNGLSGKTDLEERMHRAAARAAKRTGAAIITHGLTFALELLDVIQSEKLDLSRVVVSHCDIVGGIDLERDKKIAKRGAWACYDTFSIVPTWSWGHYAGDDETKMDLVKGMIDAGLIDRVLVSSDVNLFSVGWARSSPLTGKSTMADGLRSVFRQARRVGVSEDQFWKITVENPKEVIPIQ